MTSFYNFRAIERPNYNTSVKLRTKMIQAIFDFSLIFRTCYFQQRHSSHSKVSFGHRGHLNGFLLQFSSSTHALCDRYNAQVRPHQVSKIRRQKSRKRNESGIMNPHWTALVQYERKFCSLPVNTPQLARYPRLLHAKPSNKVYLGYL